MESRLPSRALRVAHDEVELAAFWAAAPAVRSGDVGGVSHATNERRNGALRRVGRDRRQVTKNTNASTADSKGIAISADVAGAAGGERLQRSGCSSVVAVRRRR